MDRYITNFKNSANIIEDYKAPTYALDNATVHLAWYGYGDYCGKSLVIFERDGKLFEVNAYHCSCFGLEDQWKPEETSWDALAMRDLTGDYDGADEAHAALQELVSKHLNERLMVRTKGRLIRDEENG